MKAEYEIDNGKKYPIIWRKKGSNKTDNCPYCNKGHMHGSNEGHRSAHCKSFIKYGKMYSKFETPEAYQFTADDGDIIYATNGYILREYHD